ncbi:hypothetical protein [Reinekea blandensis]|uniref:Uncharacterized protein n=1 Tax=Reinekea blandensis MED297 TaxID=314283 RepID=A4B9Z7_9GAMM|nr:hypothetical protein [Reinekea blandensis]EAR11448.1 hypothetical protein MED297_21212 [Reinekea sp. MED297] [Reinekea blandensis MED297]
MLTQADLRAYVAPFYEDKDSMHNLAHVDRLYSKALQLSQHYQCDAQWLLAGAYFHGVDDRAAIETDAESIGENDDWIATVNERVNDSYPESKPETIEGKILHDAQGPVHTISVHSAEIKIINDKAERANSGCST